MRRSLSSLLPLWISTTWASSAPEAPSPTLFVVAERVPVHGDSYLLPLTDSLDIADARALIAEGPQSGVGSIVVARIAAGSDGVNRDVLAPGEPPWSWHVTAFVGFADAAIEICDGWPGYVESDVDGWIANTNGTVCFWSYTVVAEWGQVGTRRATWSGIKALYGAKVPEGGGRAGVPGPAVATGLFGPPGASPP